MESLSHEICIFSHHIQAESLLHPITQQFILLRDTVSYYASSSSPGTSHPEDPPPSGGGFLGGLGGRGVHQVLEAGPADGVDRPQGTEGGWGHATAAQ